MCVRHQLLSKKVAPLGSASSAVASIAAVCCVILTRMDAKTLSARRTASILTAALFTTFGCHQIAPYDHTAAWDGAIHDTTVSNVSVPDERLAFEGPGDARGDGSLPDVSADARADGSRPDASHDAQDDGPLIDVRLDADAATGLQLVFEFRTISVDPHLFALRATKQGLDLRWDLGDGTIVDTNEVDHSYAQSGEKVVRVFSRDGVLGITGLNLFAAQLTGVIPPEIAGLENLDTLYLYDNELTGRIPPELGNLLNLKILNLRSNGLTGGIPAALAKLKSLSQLYLHINPLGGPIPSEVGDLSNLETLHLGSTQITGNIPPEIGGLTKLASLFLQGNQLDGSIPLEISQLAKLQTLDLHSNNLSVYTSGALSGLRHLCAVRVHYNQLPEAALDAIIDDIYQDRDQHDCPSARFLELGGTNGAPSAVGLSQVLTLKTNYGWTITCNGC